MVLHLSPRGSLFLPVFHFHHLLSRHIAHGSLAADVQFLLHSCLPIALTTLKDNIFVSLPPPAFVHVYLY